MEAAGYGFERDWSIETSEMVIAHVLATAIPCAALEAGANGRLIGDLAGLLSNVQLELATDVIDSCCNYATLVQGLEQLE